MVKKPLLIIFLCIAVSMGLFVCGLPEARAQSKTVELNGDVLNYSVDGEKISAEGNVVVVKEKTTLSCDRVEFSQETSIAKAEGNVTLVTPQGKIEGNNLIFNFDTMTGHFREAQIYSHPYYGFADKVAKVSDNEINLLDGYITTSDFDEPEYRITSKKIEIYPGEKLVARNILWYFGKVPVLYLPKFAQSLKDKKPRFIFTPGYDKEWGIFLLTQWRYYLSENFKGTIHVDAREKKDIATGVDLEYKTDGYGSGVIYTYYMNERSITSKRFYEERPSPTIERERFKINWRHKWKINDTTSTILQYYKLSDKTILKDYFEKEHDKNSNPKTYFLLTKRLPHSHLSFRTDIRVNRFTSQVERLPEINYNYANQKIGDTNFYFSSKSKYSNLVEKSAAPSEVRQKTHRMYTDNQVSYQQKIGFIKFKPYVGGSHTYYSRTKPGVEDNAVRGVFETGASLNTRFYRVFDTQMDKFGMEINRLRHVISPSVSYKYRHPPTVANNELDQYDGIDSIGRSHSVNFLLENKLQTKRDGESVDLIRFSTETDFRLKEHPGKGGFENITNEATFRPVDWLTLRTDSIYNTRKEYMTTANFDLYVNDPDGDWQWSFGKRWHREVDDQITTEFQWQINPLWAFQVYERYDLDEGSQKEQSFTITRDLHSWIMDITFTEKRGEGSEILFVFTLKAFPDIGFDFGSSFNKRKAGSQSR